MTRLYTFILLFCCILTAGCSKDFLKPYDERVVGTWRIDDVNRIGIGGDRAALPFREGRLTFSDNGTLVYTNIAGTAYTGRWDIRRKNTDDGVERSLQLTVTDPATGSPVSEYYDDIVFLGTDHFRATLVVGIVTYNTHFKR